MLEIKTLKKRKVKKRKQDEESVKKLKIKLKDADWRLVEKSSSPCKEFYKIFNNILNQTCPKHIPKGDRNYVPQRPWMTTDILNKRKEKFRLWKKWKASKNKDVLLKFKQEKNKCNTIMRKAQKEYLNTQIKENYANGRKIWELVNEFINRKQKNKDEINEIVVENKKITDPQEIADTFNNFFSTIGTSLAAKMPPCELEEELPRKRNVEMKFTEVTQAEIKKILSGMKKKRSTGYDDLSNKLLKEISPEILQPLTYIINNAIKTRTFPNEMKIAKVIPIFKKKGAITDCGNYRPISLLPTISKILEKIMDEQIRYFMSDHRHWSPNQFGFRKFHETSHAIIQALNYITKAKHKGEECLAVFMDLKKAFDTVNHSRLLLKLQKYGIDPTLLKSYLSERTQYVLLDDTNSEQKPITCGVPQGSILGPTLFLIYINDITEKLADQNILLFADDTSIIFQGKTKEDLIQKTNIQLKKLQKWFEINRLTVHPQKSNFMVFLSKEAPFYDSKICLGDHNLERIGRGCNETSVKYVGIHIDDHLTFREHAAHVQRKITQNLYLLSANKNFLPFETQKLLYNALLRPYLDYGAEIWGRKHLKLINTLQKNVSDT